MKLTNVHNIPQVIVDAIANDDYDRGPADISISQLVNPPRLVTLYERHKDELTEDASEGLWRLLGKAVHKVLADAGHDALTEERLSIPVTPFNTTWTVSGAFDSLSVDCPDWSKGLLKTAAEWRESEWVLRDHKVTSAWTRVYGSRVEEWEAQLNLYALLLHHHGFNVSRAAVNAIYRDWTKNQALRSTDYPQVAAEEIPVNLWPIHRQEAYLTERVRLHQEAREHLPDCTPEERWAKPSTWAVMKNGRKSAVRVYNDEETAQANVGELGYVQYRPGENTRCKSYCPVRQVCEVGIAEQEEEA